MDNIIEQAKKHKLYVGSLKQNSIFNLPRPSKGEIAYATDTKELFIYNGEQWVSYSTDVTLENQGLTMGLYELNRSIISQLEDMTEFEEKIELINEFKVKTGNVFYALYGREIAYITIFTSMLKAYDSKTFGQIVIECLQNVGPIKCIDYTTNKDAIEIWVDYKGTTTCLYLFPYDNGVVAVG